MSDLTLPGPFPRRLTPDELDDLKARAMIRVGELVDASGPELVLDKNTQFTFSYQFRCGPPPDPSELCGAALGGSLPTCHLQKGHYGQHKSVNSWGPPE